MDEHAPMVHRFLAASVPAHEVDDCFQETFVSALKAYPKLRTGSNLKAWVMTIAARKAIDGHRRRARLDTSANGMPDVAAPETPEPDPELWSLVERLPAKQRGAVVLRYVNDLSYRDIAEVLDCSEAAARQNAKAGLDRLREVWT
jgi:RNA polymerase sigma factor (sigma-70 family)